MTDLLDEVQEDFKAEKYSRITRNVTYSFIVIVVITLLAVGIYVWKENASDKMQKELSVIFNQALLSSEDNKLDDSIIYFNQIIEHPHQEYASLSYLNKAAILVKQDKYEEAKKTLSEMIGHKHFDLALRELAEITILSNQLNSKNNDVAINNEEFDRLTKDNKPWKLLALQLKALYQIKQNDLAGAKESLELVMNSSQVNKSSKDIATSILSSIRSSN